MKTDVQTVSFCVSILASFCVWTKSFMCKDAVNMDSTCQSIFRRLCTAKKIEDFRFPVNRPHDVSSRPEAHLFTVPSVRTMCSSRPDARQTSIIRPDDVSFPLGPYTVSRSFYPAYVRPDISAARPDAYQYSNSLRFFPSSNKGKIDQPSGRASP
jgi:hypothetical protein